MLHCIVNGTYIVKLQGSVSTVEEVQETHDDRTKEEIQVTILL